MEMNTRDSLPPSTTDRLRSHAGWPVGANSDNKTLIIYEPRLFRAARGGEESRIATIPASSDRRLGQVSEPTH